jgi:hypothetical protein
VTQQKFKNEKLKLNVKAEAGTPESKNLKNPKIPRLLKSRLPVRGPTEKQKPNQLLFGVPIQTPYYGHFLIVIATFRRFWLSDTGNGILPNRNAGHCGLCGRCAIGG